MNIKCIRHTCRTSKSPEIMMFVCLFGDKHRNLMRLAPYNRDINYLIEPNDKHGSR